MPSADTRRSTRVAWALLIVCGLIALLVLVAIGSRASHPLGHGHVRQREVPARVGNDLLTLLLILFGLCLAAWVAALAILRGKWEPKESYWLRNFLTTLAICLFAGIIGYKIIHSGHFSHHRGKASTTTGSSAPRRGRGLLRNPPVAKTPARFDWEFAAALGGLALLASAYMYMRREREEVAAEPAPGEAEQALAEVVRETIDDLRREADPRRAVIAAYARMEGVLARNGFRRRPAQAPYEYLERVLPKLHVAPEAVHELTELFELAKFSPHRVDESMRNRALAAFVSLRDGLKAAA